MQAYKSTDLNRPEFRQALNEATKLWAEKCEAYVKENGDVGSCVIGAGIEIEVIPKGCRKPRRQIVISNHDVTRVQGSCVWEASQREVVQFLKDKGIECRFNYGILD